MVGLVICKTYSTANAEAVMEHIELEEPSMVWIWNLWLQLYEVCPHPPPPPHTHTPNPILWPLKPYWTCTVPTVVLVPPIPDSCQTTASLTTLDFTTTARHQTQWTYCHCLTSDTVDFAVTASHQKLYFTVTARHQTQWTLLSLPDIRHNGLYCHCLTLDTLYFTVTARHQTHWTLLSLPDIKHWTLPPLPDIRNTGLYPYCLTSNRLDFATTACHQTHWTLPPLLVIKHTSGLYHHCQISDTVDFYCHYLAIISSAPPPPPPLLCWCDNH